METEKAKGLPVKEEMQVQIKILGLTLAGLLLVGVGCASRYTITLSNGHKITSKGKPQYDEQTGAYRYKDMQGRVRTMPGFRIQEIAPN